MKLYLFLTVCVWINLELVSPKIHDVEQIVNVWPKFDLLCTKIRIRKDARKFYGSCRPLHYTSTQSTVLYKQLESRLIYEFKSYQIRAISTSPVEEHQVDVILNQTLVSVLQEIRLKVLQATAHQFSDKKLLDHLMDSLIRQAQNDKNSPIFEVFSQLKAKIRNSLIVREKQEQLPEIVIWFVQEKQLGKRQLEYLQILWTKHAYFQLANYLSQYDLKLKERLAATDPFKFNNNRVLLIELFRYIHRDYEHRTGIQLVATSSLSVKSRITTYLSNYGCEQSYREKAHALLHRHHYTILVQCLFPNASNTILQRYQQISGHVVLKQHDFLNILNLIDEGWMQSYLGHPCHQQIQHEARNNFQYLESAQQLQMPNHYFTENDLTYKQARLGRRKSPYYYIGAHSVDKKPLANEYQSYFTQLADL